MREAIFAVLILLAACQVESSANDVDASEGREITGDELIDYINGETLRCTTPNRLSYVQQFEASGGPLYSYEVIILETGHSTSGAYREREDGRFERVDGFLRTFILMPDESVKIAGLGAEEVIDSASATCRKD